MRITIASRFSPFSHECGERFLFPETAVCIQVFPTRLVLIEEGQSPVTIDFSWTGVVKEFTAQLNCERKELTVFGFAKEGYFSYRIVRNGGQLVLMIDKVPSLSNEKKGITSLLTLKTVSDKKTTGRLSLGSHKAQEFYQMKKRRDPCELIPLWIQMGSLCPDVVTGENKGPFALLSELEELIVNEKKCEVIDKILTFFQASFHGVFVPRLNDDEYQGIVQGLAQGSALPLLTQSANLLASLFYKQSAKEIEILPLLPPELHCGRWVDIPLACGGSLHFEWTKKALRRVFLNSGENQELSLVVPKGISACRITGKKGMVKKERIERGHLILSLQQGERLALDRFST